MRAGMAGRVLRKINGKQDAPAAPRGRAGPHQLCCPRNGTHAPACQPDTGLDHHKVMPARAARVIHFINGVRGRAP
jgi:hypothetical protein